MSKRQIIMLLGLLVIFTALFSGLPASWNNIIYIVIGLLIIVVSYTTHKIPSKNIDKEPEQPYVDMNKE